VGQQSNNHSLSAALLPNYSAATPEIEENPLRESQDAYQIKESKP
jgi:hypothetical protein